jgi:hypothetical protein
MSMENGLRTETEHDMLGTGYVNVGNDNIQRRESKNKFTGVNRGSQDDCVHHACECHIRDATIGEASRVD